jgi:tape measure domain-containing protein
MQLAQIGLDAGRRFGDAFTSSITTSMNFEKLNRTLTVITGSTAAAAKELEYLGGVTKRLNLPIEEATRGYTQLTAAAKGTILEGEGVRQIFTAISSASKVLGLSSAETSRALNAVQQMISKGKISSEELRQQLGEVMPGAFQAFAKSLGVTTQELDKLLENGEVGIDSLLYFAQQLQKEYGKAATATNTLNDRFTAFNNSVKESQKLFGDLLQPVVIAGVETITSLLGGINVDLGTARGVIEKVAEWLSNSRDEAAALGNMIGSGINSALSITADLIRAGEEYLQKYPAVLDFIKLGVDAISAGFRVWGDMLNGLTTLLGNIANLIGEVATKLKESGLIEWMRQSGENIFGSGVSGGSSLYQAIIGKESGGNYRAVNPDSGALGLGQVMPANVPSWTKAALGRSLTPQQFLNDPQAQQKTIEYKLQEMYNRAIKATGGNEREAVRRVAAEWYSGNPNLANSTKSQGKYPTIASYTNSIADKVVGNPVSGRSVAASIASEGSGTSTLPPWKPSVSAGDAKKEAEKAKKDREKALEKQRREAEKASREARQRLEQADRDRAAAIAQRRADRDLAFDLETRKGALGLSGDALSRYNDSRSNTSRIQGYHDQREDLVAARAVKLRDGVKGGVDYSAAIANLDKLIAGEKSLNSEVDKRAAREKEIADQSKAFFDTQQRTLAIEKLRATLKEREATRIMQGLDYQGRRDKFAEWTSESRMASIAARSESYVRASDYAERWKHLGELLKENYEKSHQLEIQIRDGIGGAFTDAISSFITGTKSLGDVALDLLSNLSSRLLDLGLNSILGSGSSGKGIFGSLLGGLFGGGTPNFDFKSKSFPIPKFATGGMMQHDGLAYLHQGEQVLTPGQQRGTGQVVINAPINITNHGEGAMSDKQVQRLHEQTVESVRRVVEAEMLRQKMPGGMFF